MPSSPNVPGQATISLKMHDAPGPVRGMSVDSPVNPADASAQRAFQPARNIVPPDRFDAARGKADVPWRTQDLMNQLRS